MRVKGFSTSSRDAVALVAMVAGVLVTVFAGQPVGKLVMELSGSLVLGTGVWVLSLLVGVALFLGGFAWLLTERRSYRCPEDDRAPRKVESIL